MDLNNISLGAAVLLIAVGNAGKIVLVLTRHIKVSVTGEAKARLVYVFLGLLSVVGWSIVTIFALSGQEIIQTAMNCPLGK